MRFGLDVAQHQLSYEELRSRVLFAEELGFEGAWVFDHFRPLYGDPSGPCLEAWTLLAALAEATSRIRLGPLVSGLTYRHPSVLAAEALTVDHVSGGRLDFAVGAGWYEPEHVALGIPFPSAGERVERFEEALTVIESLWTTDGARVTGRHFSLDEGSLHPRPIQRPHPPIWIGAGGPRMIGVAARHADMWHSFGTPAGLGDASSLLSREAEAAGRDPAMIGRASSISLEQSLDAITREVEAWGAAGFEYLVAGWPPQGRPVVEAFAQVFLEG